MEASGRRGAGERRRSIGRREEDHAVRGPVRGAATPLTVFWAIIGGIVVLYLFFVALGAVEPRDAPAASIAIAVLALLWLLHSWRRLWRDHPSPSSDRERRGF
jgi:hypothetical protein